MIEISITDRTLNVTIATDGEDNLERCFISDQLFAQIMGWA